MSQIKKNEIKQVSGLEEISLIVKTKSFQKILQIFQTILEKKSIIPIFSNLKIAISKNKIFLTGMNIDLAAINEIEIINLLYDPDDQQSDDQLNNEKILVLNGHLFYDVIKKISSEEIRINKKYGNNFIEINADEFFCKLSLQENEKFPTIETLENHPEYKIYANILYDSIESVLSCAAVHDSRAFLCAIKIIQNNSDNSVEFIATDGHRMAHLKSSEKQFEIESNKNSDDLESENHENELSLILPRKTAVFVLKFLKENQGRKISFRLSNQKIIFLFDDPNDEFLKIKII
jgi:DNA polymerase-3 subunit beta